MPLETGGGGLARLHPQAVAQIEALLTEKAARTPVQRKVSSQLLLAAKGPPAELDWKDDASLISTASRDEAGRTLLDVQGDLDEATLAKVVALGGTVVKATLGSNAGAGAGPGAGMTTGPSASPSARPRAMVRVWLPLSQVEALAAEPAVASIRPALEARTWRVEPPRGATKHLLATREERVAAVQRAITQLGRRPPRPGPGVTPGATPGSVSSEGLAAHEADRARKFFNTDGTGVKIGVLSDSDDWKEQSIASGDLPADTFTLPGEDGRPGSGEGTAMMEIVHDLAPGAKLYFASAFNGPQSFAANIRALRFTYGCDIIIDDVIYFFESPFQDDTIAQAVDDVTASGALYFSSAGNQGNLSDGTSGVWEGDFRPGGTLATLGSGYTVHDFGDKVISNRIEAYGGPLVLHWSDPGTLDAPASANDYDVFVLDEDLRTVLAASTDVQDGTGLPFEFVGYLIPANLRVVVAKSPTAQRRALHLALYGGELGLGTAGSTHGHNSARSAVGTAAVDALESRGAPFTSGPLTPVELFSSDGPRWIFHDRSNRPLRSGLTFSSGGGEQRRKPDLAAADGVSTTLPPNSGLNPFFGTSAAAPHAGAIAALMKSAVPSAPAERLRRALLSSALDVEAQGFDRDTGAGIATAMGGLESLGATPAVFLELGALTVTPVGADALLPGGSATVAVALMNNGGAPASSVKATLSTASPYATVTQRNTTFPTIAPGATASGTTPFSLALAPSAPCGATIALTLSVSFTGPGTSPTVFQRSAQSGRVARTPVVARYAGPPVAIPDDDLGGVDITLPVTGVGLVSGAVFSLDGTECSAAAGSTTVGLAHSWAGDVIARLTAPDGRRVTLISQAGGPMNSGNNFCQTVLSDTAASSIQDISGTGAPWTGSFRPQRPLAGFVGAPGDGTWVLNVADAAAFDTGVVQAFSLSLTGFTCDAETALPERP